MEHESHLGNIQGIRMRKKIWIFAEHPISWGGIGVLLGAIGVAYSIKVMFVVTSCILAVAIVRTQFFEGRKLYQRGLGNLVLIIFMAGLLFLLWRVTPKSKEPPTAEEIANAVIKKQREETHATSGSPRTEPDKTSEPNKTAGRPSQKPTKSNKEAPTAKTVPEPVVPPQTARLIVSQKSQISTREDASYKTEVTIQTTSEFPSLKLLIRCDKPLVDGTGGFAGVLMMTSQGLLKDQPNVYIFTYQSAAPPFGPQSPIVLNLWSNEPIKCEAVTF